MSFLCVLPLLLPVPVTFPALGDGKARVSTATSPGDAGIPATFTWADLADDGQGRFEDVTEPACHAVFALWADYDLDGRLDLFVAREEGPSLLFHNEGGTFVDMSAGSGLIVEGTVRAAQWLDHDGDGRPDLFVGTTGGNKLFRGLEGGFFEASEVPTLAPAIPAASSGAGSAGTDATPSATGGASRGDGAGTTSAGSALGSVSSGRVPLGPTSPLTLNPPTLLGFPLTCALSTRDQANPSSCLQASSTPALGRLYPISANRFVAVGGNVGIGTTTPSARLEVAGTARITDTLTLAPGSDQALDVATGSIYKGGALFAHTEGGTGNTALGRQALQSVTSGYLNTASGNRALRSNTTGERNIAIGAFAGSSGATGNNNIAIGSYGVGGESATIRIGTSFTHTRTFIAGIRGVTAGVANAIPVLVDSAGQLGTVSSSRRFKEDIADMGDATERRLDLRPVVFRCKQERSVPSGEVPLEYGLIAAEVAEVFPELVVHDEEGKPFTVKYHLLASMLLNELEKLRTEHDDLRGEHEALRLEHARALGQLEGRLAALESRLIGAPPSSAESP